MGIPEHNLCVRNNKYERKTRRRAIAMYGMRPGKYWRKGKCKTWKKYRTRHIIGIELDINRRNTMKMFNVSTLREVWDAVGISYGRYGKYDN